MWSSVTPAIPAQDLYIFVAVCTATGINATSRLATAKVSSSNVLVGTLEPYTEYKVQVVALVKGQTNRTIAMRSSSVVLLRTKEDGEFFTIKDVMQSMIFLSKSKYFKKSVKTKNNGADNAIPHPRGVLTYMAIYTYVRPQRVSFLCGPKKVCLSLWIGIVASWAPGNALDILAIKSIVFVRSKKKVCCHYGLASWHRGLLAMHWIFCL